MLVSVNTQMRWLTMTDIRIIKSRHITLTPPRTPGMIYVMYCCKYISSRPNFPCNFYSYGYDEWKDGNDTRDHYSAPSKSSNELPQVSSHYNQKSQLSSQAPSPFTSQSTVKEMSIAPSTVQAVAASSHHPHDYSSTNFPINSSGYGNVEDSSFYDASSTYNNHTQVDHLAQSVRTDATVPTITSTSNNEDVEQYMDAYENQTGYEDWQNYGYYDDAGNYIQYDQNSYYPEEQPVSVIPAETHHPPTQTQSEKDPYSSYYDQSQAHNSTTTNAAITAITDPATTSYIHDVMAADTTKVSVHQDPSLYNDEQYDPNNYTMSEVAGDPQPQNYDQSIVQDGYYGSYDQDGYWYDATEEDTSYLQTQTVQPATEPVISLSNNSGLKSNDEYNYAYQSSENLTAYEPSTAAHGAKLDKAESVSRRGSFKRQVSTRSDFGAPTTIPQTFHKDTNHVPISTPAIPVATTTPPTSTTAPTSTTSAATNAAAVVASKFASEMKSALPQLSSLTKGKSDLFSSSFSKFGNFMSNAAEKAGVQVPLMNQNKEAAAKLEQEKLLETQAQVVPQHQPIPEISIDHGLGYSMEDQQYQYDNWEGQYGEHYDDQYHDYNPETGIGYEHYEEGIEGNLGSGLDEQSKWGAGGEHPDELNKKEPVHMDSLESNVSEGARDAEDLEAEYWQKGISIF